MQQDVVSISNLFEEYWTKGYTIVRSVLAEDQVDELRAETTRLFSVPSLNDDFNIRTEVRRDVQTDWAVDRLDPVIDLSPIFLDAVSSPNLLSALAQILRGTPQLLKCKLIRKNPGIGGYLLHQDYLYWRWLNTHPDRLCSVAIALYPADELSGGIELYSGLHHTQIVGSDGSLDRDCQLNHAKQLRSEIPNLNAGDALIFHSLAPHRSEANRSAFPRTILLPSYITNAEPDIYLKYYRREIERRASEYVGFERFEQMHERMVARFTSQTVKF